MTNLFSELLEKEMNSNNNYSNICLISRELLNDIHINLPCKHKYNYYPIYREVINQRKTYKFKSPKIQCPYCRKSHKCVLPYIKMSGVEHIKWVNFPVKYQLLPNKCSYVFKSNASKVCNKPCMNSMCQYHIKISSNSNISEEEMTLMASETDLYLYSVAKLRAFAKYNKIKGYSTLKKQDLVTLIQEYI